MNFKRNLNITMLSLLIAGSVKAGNTLDQVLKTAETLVGPITYALSHKATSATGLSSDMQATINASVALTAMETRDQLKENDATTSKRLKRVATEAAKPWLVLTTLKYGLPILNKVFQQLNLPQLVTNEPVSAINAQKIVLFYVGLSKAIGLLNEK